MEIDKTKTNPGMHKSFLSRSFTRTEQEILRKLRNEWYLTNSGENVQLGYSTDLRYFLMKPTTIYQEMFNLEREIVCVFSPYPNFEPRTLDAFDYGASKFPALRVDNVCRVLISNDPFTERKVNDMLKNDPEQPIVVPFTYDELSNPYDDYFLRNRFRKHFYSRDLFSFLSPLRTDLYFFGRTQLIQDIVNRHRSSENSGLFGLRKSGKTSIIYGIERFLKSHNGQFVSIDCENPSIHKLRWNELLFRLVEMIKDVKGSNYRISSIEQFKEKNAANRFESDLLGLYESKDHVPMLLIFDEIERISPVTGSSSHWRDEEDFVYFWQTLRYFFQKFPSVFSYLLVGTNSHCVETPKFGHHDNPLFSSIPFQYVPPFDVEKTRDMVRKLGRYMGIKFDEIIYGKLTDDFGGHPFLIRQMCSSINKISPGDRPIQVDKALYLKAKKQFFLDSQHYLGMIVDVLKEWYADEYDMLTFLANGDIGDFEAFANESRYYVNHLIGYGLINLSKNGYSFNIESIKEYLLAKHKYEQLSLSYEQKVAEISERRNSLEKGLRKIIRNQLKAAKGRKNASIAVLSSLIESRRDKFAGFDIDDLLNIDNSPLYLSELKLIISREWDIFQNIFELEKNKLIIILDEVNEGRIDAHAKGIKDDQFVQLRLHFNTLENVLSNWL